MHRSITYTITATRDVDASTADSISTATSSAAYVTQLANTLTSQGYTVTVAAATTKALPIQSSETSASGGDGESGGVGMIAGAAAGGVLFGAGAVVVGVWWYKRSATDPAEPPKATTKRYDKTGSVDAKPEVALSGMGQVGDAQPLHVADRIRQLRNQLQQPHLTSPENSETELPRAREVEEDASHDAIDPSEVGLAGMGELGLNAKLPDEIEVTVECASNEPSTPASRYGRLAQLLGNRPRSRTCDHSNNTEANQEEHICVPSGAEEPASRSFGDVASIGPGLAMDDISLSKFDCSSMLPSPPAAPRPKRLGPRPRRLSPCHRPPPYTPQDSNQSLQDQKPSQSLQDQKPSLTTVSSDDSLEN